MLNGEMDQHLSSEASDGRANTRNGYGQKTVLTDTGRLALDIPRDRQGTFDPQLIANISGVFPGFDEKIVSLYARGMRYRHVQQVFSARPQARSAALCWDYAACACSGLISNGRRLLATL